MTRTVICIFKGGGQSSFQIQLHKALGDLPREAYPLNNLLNDPVFDQIKKGTLKANTLKQAGRLLFRELTTHSALRDAMKLVLATPVGNCTPIYVNMMCGEMDALPWEILYHRDGSFLALDKRWPIGRIADSTVNIPLYPRTFEFPLRVMVFLAAAKVDASFEWRAM